MGIVEKLLSSTKAATRWARAWRAGVEGRESAAAASVTAREAAPPPAAGRGDRASPPPPPPPPPAWQRDSRSAGAAGHRPREVFENSRPGAPRDEAGRFVCRSSEGGSPLREPPPCGRRAPEEEEEPPPSLREGTSREVGGPGRHRGGFAAADGCGEGSLRYPCEATATLHAGRARAGYDQERPAGSLEQDSKSLLEAAPHESAGGVARVTSPSDSAATDGAPPEGATGASAGADEIASSGGQLARGPSRVNSEAVLAGEEVGAVPSARGGREAPSEAPTRFGKTWSDEEIATLKRLGRAAEVDWAEVAGTLSRTPNACRSKFRDIASRS